MSLSINTNLNAQLAQRQLGQSASVIAGAVRQLSSGLRINGAADDPAGLAIASRMSAQIQASDQGLRNANDGISMIQTAEAALATMGDNLQRVRVLALQAANGGLTAADRASLQQEASQLIAANDQIAAQTQFNGVALLDGSFQGQQIQVGSNRQQTASLGALPDMLGTQLGRGYGVSFYSPGTITVGAASNLVVTLGGVGKVFDLGPVATDAKAIVNAINTAQIPGLSASSNGYAITGPPVTSNGTASGTATLTLNGVAIALDYTAGGGAALTSNVVNAVTAINAQSAATGVIASVSNGRIRLAQSESNNLTIAFSAGTATGGTTSDFGLGSAGTSVCSVSVSYSGDATDGVTSVAVTGAGLSAVPPASLQALNAGLDSMNLSTMLFGQAFGARLAMASLDPAINLIAATRAKLGAAQNQLQSAISNQQNSSLNLSAARSRVQDADFAQQTSELSRAQILQQAATAMVAQANQQPQSVLALLK